MQDPFGLWPSGQRQQEVWFIAGPTNLEPINARFFNENNISTRIFRGYVNILETKMINITIDNINIVNKILDMLKSYTDPDFLPRFTLIKPNDDDEIVHDGEYITNYISIDKGCECCPLYQYALSETLQTIRCFMKNGKYYGNYHIINKKLILTQEEIDEINKRNMDEYNNHGSGCCSTLDFF